MNVPSALRAPSLLLAAGAFAGVTAAAAQSVAEYSTGIFVAAAALFLFRKLRSSFTIFIAAFSLVFISALSDRPPVVPVGDSVRLTARIESTHCGERSQRAIATVPDAAYPYRISLRIIDITPELRAGDLVEISTTLRAADRYAGLPRAGIEALSARSDRVSASAVLTPSDIRIIGHADGLRYRSEAIRHKLADAIYSSGLAPDVARTLAAACLGGDYLGGEELRTYRSAGMAHLFCVSGFHVGVLAALAAMLLWPLRLWQRSLQWHRPLTLLSVWLYAALTGFSPSVMRAAAMISCYFAARAMQRGNASLNGLCLAFFAVLLLSPYSLYSAGFQLSFAAVASLLLFARALNPVPERYRCLHGMAALLVVPLAATLGTLPVMLAWFHTIPLTSVPANAMATLFFAPLIYTGALASAFGWTWAAQLCAFLHHLLDSTATLWADVNAAIGFTWLPSAPALAAMVVALAALAMTLHSGHRRRRAVAGIVGVLSILVAACTPSPRAVRGLYADSAGKGTLLLAVDGDRACCIALDDEAGGSNAAFENICLGYGLEAEVYPAADFDAGIAARRCSRIEACGISIALADADEDIGQATVLYVSRAFRGDIEQRLADVRPAAVLLSASASPRLRLRVKEACGHWNIPCHDLLIEAAVLPLTPGSGGG